MYIEVFFYSIGIISELQECSLAAELNVFFQKDTVRKHQKQGKQQHTPSKIPEVIEAVFGDISGSEERVGRQKADSSVTDDVGEAGNAILHKYD